MSSTFIVSASYDKEIRFWDGSTGRTVRSFPFQGSQVNAMLTIPNTTHLAVGGFGAVRVYDIGVEAGSAGGNSGTQPPPIFSVYENQYAMNVTSLGTFPLYPQRDEEMHLNSAEASMSSLFCTSADLAATATLDPTPTTGSAGVLTVLFATSEDGHIRFFNANSPTTLNLLLDISAGAAITCSAVSPDRHTLFTGSQIGRVSVWHIPSIVAAAAQHGDSTSRGGLFASKPMQEIAFNGDYTAIRSIAVEPLARWAVAATSAGKLHFMCFGRCAQNLTGTHASEAHAAGRLANEEVPGEEEETSPQVQRPVAEGTVADSAPAIATNDSSSRSINSANTLRPSCGPLSVLKTHGNEGSGGDVAANASESPLANDGVTFSDAVDASDTGNSAPGMDVTKKFSAPGLLTSSSVNSSSIQQQFFLKVFHSFQAHHKYILKVAISPNIDILVTCCGDYTVGRFVIPPILQCCDVTTKHASGCESDSHSAGVSSLTSAVRLSGLTEKNTAAGSDPTNQVAAAGDNNGAGAGGATAASSSSLLQPKADEGAVLTPTAAPSTSFTHDGSTGSVEDGVKPVAAVANDPTVNESQPLATMETVKKMTSPADAPTERHDAFHLAMSNFPQLVAEGSTQVNIGDGVEFKELKPLTGHTRWVWDCAFSDCGRFLFTASSDQTLRMWTSLLSDRPHSTSFVGHMKPVVCCMLYVERKKNQ